MDLVMRCLENLQFLNGLPVEREGEEGGEDEQEDLGLETQAQEEAPRKSHNQNPILEINDDYQ